MKGEIVLVGLGPGNPQHISLGAWQAIKNAGKLLLRTARHPAVELLEQEGITYTSFDACYEKGASFEEVYSQIAQAVLDEAARGPVVFAVPGHPLVGETAVEKIMTAAGKQGIPCRVVPSMSFIDAVYTAVGPGLAEKVAVVDALSLAKWKPGPGVGYIIYQVYDRFIASDVKLQLMEYYPPEHPLQVIKAAGIPELERVEQICLYQLDRLDWIDHLTSLYIYPLGEAGRAGGARFPLDPLVEVMARLRGENGCPWDREQDHFSLTSYLLEETYEVLDALGQGNMHKFCEELGDLLLQIVFHAQIATENGHFDVNDIVDSITRKMIRRHPHVFGDTAVENSSQVLENWEKIKQEEKSGVRKTSLLDGVPGSLPALLRASKVQEKAARVGFDWPDYQGPLIKIGEELEELLHAYHAGDRSMVLHELGDLLFAVVNLSRFFRVEPEAALSNAVERFCRRFRFIEDRVEEMGKNLEQCSLEELDRLWERAKKVEN